MYCIVIGLLSLSTTARSFGYHPPLNLREGFSCITKLYQERGTCKFYENCPEALLRHENFVQPELCGFIGDKPLICCISNHQDCLTDPSLPGFASNEGNPNIQRPSPNTAISPLLPLTQMPNINRDGYDCISKETNEPGICRHPENCPVYGTRSKNFWFNDDSCGFSEFAPIICCVTRYISNDDGNYDSDNSTNNLDRIEDNRNGNASQQINLPTSTMGSSGRPQLARNPGVLSRSRCEAYYPIITDPVLAVAGGKESLPKEFPHMAALGYGDRNNKKWNCGGSLISKKYVLTAAHCLTSSLGGPRYVRLGDLNLFSDDDDAQPQDFDVVRSIPHPAFNSPVRYHDIALLELDREIQRTEYVSPACLYAGRQVEQRSLTATGWGRTGFSEDSSDSLLKVDLDHVPARECASIYGFSQEIPNGVIEDFQVCAGGTTGKDTCMGDSGGPLQITNYRKFVRYSVNAIVGVTSFGKACALSPTPGVYTRVARYIPWIETIAWQGETD